MYAWLIICMCTLRKQREFSDNDRATISTKVSYIHTYACIFVLSKLHNLFCQHLKYFSDMLAHVSLISCNICTLSFLYQILKFSAAWDFICCSESVCYCKCRAQKNRASSLKQLLWYINISNNCCTYKI